ncbi:MULTISPECIES: HAD family hydrolase [unclassified Streptomyces]|uniref:HAD family hydrolase n=1 Tax=unclassified Streptomyces TaxID=2593676 RepID=UPI001BEC3B40|nr:MULTISPECIES: HAD family hydrolase [unclassified Streptomyces]MBT2406345.1 HAD family hydrolase [Streptomyces sp. ISL-21]MBT2607559.1 HAD family hydrolase [Streptomyces sp. ISL-87]
MPVRERRLEDVLAGYPVVVFDLDGVIVDSNELKADCVREVFAGFPGELVEGFVAEFRRTFGRSRRAHFAAFHSGGMERGLAGPDFEEFYERYAGAYAALLAERYPRAPLCAHAERLVTALSARGVPLHVATGTLTAEAVGVLGGAGLLGAFRSVLGGEEPKSRRLAQILARAGADPREAVLIGDSRQDALAADEAGTDFLLVTRYGFFPPEQVLHDRPGRAARTVTDLDPDGPVHESPAPAAIAGIAGIATAAVTAVTAVTAPRG